jgi:hypothetical protein
MEFYKIYCTCFTTFFLIAMLLNIPIEVKQINPKRGAFFMKK